MGYGEKKKIFIYKKPCLFNKTPVFDVRIYMALYSWRVIFTALMFNQIKLPPYRPECSSNFDNHNVMDDYLKQNAKKQKKEVKFHQILLTSPTTTCVSLFKQYIDEAIRVCKIM